MSWAWGLILLSLLSACSLNRSPGTKESSLIPMAQMDLEERSVVSAGCRGAASPSYPARSAQVCSSQLQALCVCRWGDAFQSWMAAQFAQTARYLHPKGGGTNASSRSQPSRCTCPDETFPSQPNGKSAISCVFLCHIRYSRGPCAGCVPQLGSGHGQSRHLVPFPLPGDAPTFPSQQPPDPPLISGAPGLPGSPRPL